MNRMPILCSLATLLLLGCKGPETRPVLRQDIPVSTVPLGAKILVDGQPAGQTPTTLSLERTRDHIVTLLLDSYRQEDVILKHQYQQERTLLKAVQHGLDAGLFFKDARMGLVSGSATMDAQERSGEAYVLVPSAISVSLQPAGSGSHAPGSPAQLATGPEAAAADSKARARDLALAGAAVAVAAAQPEAKKTWDKSSSETRVSADGRTVTRTETRTSTGVKVGVSPEGVARILQKLFQ